MVIKLLMFVGLHNVYPAMDVNFTFRWKVKIPLPVILCLWEKKMHELLVKNRKERKKKREKN